jgi:hypothetical protein
MVLSYCAESTAPRCDFLATQEVVSSNAACLSDEQNGGARAYTEPASSAALDDLNSQTMLGSWRNLDS